MSVPARIRSEFLLPAGMPGTGRRRYAAAMWLHVQGMLDEEALEVYRALAMDDRACASQELRRIGREPVSLEAAQ
jgi:hypothetical protein